MKNRIALMVMTLVAGVSTLTASQIVGAFGLQLGQPFGRSGAEVEFTPTGALPGFHYSVDTTLKDKLIYAIRCKAHVSSEQKAEEIVQAMIMALVDKYGTAEEKPLQNPSGLVSLTAAKAGSRSIRILWGRDPTTQDYSVRLIYIDEDLRKQRVMEIANQLSESGL